MFRIITILFLILLILRAFGKYISPLLRGDETDDRLRQMQDQMREMNAKMDKASTRKGRIKRDGDYIDYEELK
jgi:hypothetical protein